MPDLTGQSFGRYHILDPLGEGGMAIVYKAYDTRLERDVAIKVIRVDMFGQTVLQRILKRFEREAKALAKLSHPNIVKIHDFGEYEGIPYLVMEFLAGGTLKSRLAKPFSWQEAVRILLPIGNALDYAHGQDVIHRDVKPSNILISESGDPMLTDFGIAKILESNESHTLTGTGIGVGTPEYMAPEQWTGQATPQSDLYSLGVILYELITSHKPYTAETPAAILLKQATEPLPRPSLHIRDLPEAVEKVLFKALARKPEDRYLDMTALMAAMGKLLTESGQVVQTSPAVRETGKPQESVPDKSTGDSNLTTDQYKDRPIPVPLGTDRAAKDPVDLKPLQVQGTTAGERLPQKSTPAKSRPGRQAKSRKTVGMISLGGMFALAFCILAAIIFLPKLINNGIPSSLASLAETSNPGTQALDIGLPTLDISSPTIPTRSGVLDCSRVEDICIGLVTDLDRVDDLSYNQPSWEGAVQALDEDLIASAKYLESQAQADYAGNIQQFLNENTDLVFTVGFLTSVATAQAAVANPEVSFAIVEYFYPDCWPGAVVGTDCGSDVELANVRGLMFQADQAAFLAGYLAAGMTETGKVGTYGGVPIPNITLLMKGMEAGVKYYNEQKGTAVGLVGWKTATGEGLFTNNFESTDDGRAFAQSLMEQGVDIIMPVAGLVGLGSAKICQETGLCTIIGIDYDWYLKEPEYGDVILTSVVKNFDVAVYDTIADYVSSSFTSGNVYYSLADGGVDLAPFHDFDSQVPAGLKAELEEIKTMLIDGSLTVDGVLGIEW